MTARAPRGSGTVTVTVRGVSELQRAFRPLLDPELTNELDAIDKKGAQALAKELKSAARPLSRHMARAVRVKRAKTGKPGWVVGSSRKVAFWWPFVIDGTKDHGPRKADLLSFIPNWNPYLGTAPRTGASQVRAKRVRGVGAHPIVEKVAASHEDAVVRDAERDFARRTGL